MNPVQPDRLAVGHTAVLVWNTCTGEPYIGAFYVVKEKGDRNPTTLNTATADMLKDFMGKGIHHLGSIPAPEENVVPMLLVGIYQTPETGTFDLSEAIPDWFKGLKVLRLEKGLPDVLIERLKAA